MFIIAQLYSNCVGRVVTITIKGRGEILYGLPKIVDFS